jgi:hypothetical protein
MNKSLLLCTLVLEYNYSDVNETPHVDRGSVWLIGGDGRQSLNQEGPLCSLPGWTKVIGPIELETASSVHAALKSFFENNGVVLIDEGVAD